MFFLWLFCIQYLNFFPLVVHARRCWSNLNEEQPISWGSLRIKLISAPLDTPKWVWPSMNRYRMFFDQTITLPPNMHHKLTEHERCWMRNIWFPTKSHVESDDNSNFSIPCSILLVVFQDIRWCKGLLSCPQELSHETKCFPRNQCICAKRRKLNPKGSVWEVQPTTQRRRRGFLVVMESVTILNPWCASTISTIVMAPSKKKTISLTSVDDSESCADAISTDGACQSIHCIHQHMDHMS